MANLLLRQSFKSPSVYEVAIKVKDKKWLLELLTYETVEASVQKRVEMKARTYSQVVKINETGDVADPVYKIRRELLSFAQLVA
ncbi:chorismate mutase 3, chloroplastic [Trifolium repens]|nr:chorismate mutase 3, chloroplastic [Trifolium repens]